MQQFYNGIHILIKNKLHFKTRSSFLNDNENLYVKISSIDFYYI